MGENAPLSFRISQMAHGFSDEGRKQKVREYAKEAVQLEARVEQLRRCLDFFGVEVSDDGDYKFKPSTMDKWRRIQAEEETK